MNDWIWLAAMLWLGWVGFVLGVKYALPRKHISPYLWGLMNPFGPPVPWWGKDRRTEWFKENGEPWKGCVIVDPPSKPPPFNKDKISPPPRTQGP